MYRKVDVFQHLKHEYKSWFVKCEDLVKMTKNLQSSKIDYELLEEEVFSKLSLVDGGYSILNI